MLSCSGPNNPLEIICENVVFLLTGYDEWDHHGIIITSSSYDHHIVIMSSSSSQSGNRWTKPCSPQSPHTVQLELPPILCFSMLKRLNTVSWENDFPGFLLSQREEHCWCWCWCSCWCSCSCSCSCSERFAGLDWGNDEKNIAHHGTPEPPVYNLRDVNTKVKSAKGNYFELLPWFSKLFPSMIKNCPDCSFLGKQRLALRRKRPHEDCWQCKQPWSWSWWCSKGEWQCKHCLLSSHHHESWWCLKGELRNHWPWSEP